MSGNTLRDMRYEAGITAEEIAVALGVTAKTVHNIETATEPKPVYVLAYKAACGLAGDGERVISRRRPRRRVTHGYRHIPDPSLAPAA